MKTLLFSILALLGLCYHAEAQAAKLKNGYPICVTALQVEQFSSAIFTGDLITMDLLLNSGCMVTKSGVLATVTANEPMLPGIVQVQIKRGKRAAQAWTDIAALD